MSGRTTKFRWLARAAIGAFLVSIVVIPLAAAEPVGARSDAWHKNTFHVTRVGVFRADFLMPRWFQLEEFFIQIVGPTHVSHCRLHYGTTTDRARNINSGDYPDVYFSWPKKGSRSATRATATCHLAGGPVTAARVVLPWGRGEGRITLRRR